MAITLAVGTSASIVSTYGAAQAFTAATNATETVLSMAATGTIAVNDFVEVTSGWSLLDGRIARVKAFTLNVSITLELIDTSSTSQYPGGSTAAAGSVRRIAASSGFTGLTQLTSGIQIGGGDQQFADITTLQDRNQRQIPTTRAPITVTLPTFFDQSLAWVAVVRAASASGAATGLLLVYPNGSRTIANAYWSMRDMPTIEDSTLRSEISLSLASTAVTYAT